MIQTAVNDHHDVYSRGANDNLGNNVYKNHQTHISTRKKKMFNKCQLHYNHMRNNIYNVVFKELLLFKIG